VPEKKDKMVPPTGLLNLDVEAVSGICGSISIACWVVVFSPQIVENFRRGSADGLSLQFIIVWLLGDVFNILGAVLQGVLPTMIILAIYYTIADVVLLGQCFYYRGFTWRDEVIAPSTSPNKKHKRTRSRNTITSEPDERSALLSAVVAGGPIPSAQRERRGSNWSTHSHHLSPAVPLVSDVPEPVPQPPPPTRLQSAAFNLVVVLMVCGAGAAGWILSRGYTQDDKGHSDDTASDPLAFNTLGQVFGWLCAVLYLGSRLPQLLLNWRRKSTEGVSMLFFLFACLGNLTYVLSIVAFEPRCHKPKHCQPGEASGLYSQYLLVNLSWLAGSAGTLLLDMGIFIQFFMYNRDDEDDDAYIEDGEWDDDDRSIDAERWDQRPVLQRDISDF
jgi:uncharacterized protein with PQ loop repeat